MKQYIILFLTFFLYVSYANIQKTTSKKIMSETKLEIATLAGGCFWCMESVFQETKGVTSVISGFSGGKKKNPQYKEVAQGKTSHVEAIQITFNSKEITYNQLLDIYWRNIDPTDSKGQFVDRGNQYRPVIFFHNEEQRKIAEESKQSLEKLNIFQTNITTEIIEYSLFFKAGENHQDYYKKNPVKYWFYTSNSGRKEFKAKYWKSNKTQSTQPKTKQLLLKKKDKTQAINFNQYQKPPKNQLKNQLTKIQYKVTQEDGTESPFQNKYWNNKNKGIYIDIVSGEPLFSSQDKYESGTGWPSFTQPIKKESIVTKSDYKLFVKRTEVRSKYANSHLGHVFKDGPKEKTGLRYCINSASLKFIPYDKIKEQGYSEFFDLFNK